jgi:hypothetical protein
VKKNAKIGQKQRKTVKNSEKQLKNGDKCEKMGEKMGENGFLKNICTFFLALNWPFVNLMSSCMFVLINGRIRRSSWFVKYLR